MALHQPTRRSPSWMSTCRVVLLAGYSVTALMLLELADELHITALFSLPKISIFDCS